MSDLLGMSIDNASEHHAVINVKVGVQENFENMHHFAEQQQAIAEEQREVITSIPMYQIRNEVHKMYQRAEAQNPSYFSMHAMVPMQSQTQHSQ